MAITMLNIISLWIFSLPHPITLQTVSSKKYFILVDTLTGFDTEFFARGGGGGEGILASVLGQDIGICIVCFGVLVVYILIFYITHTKNYAKADIRSIWFAQL